MAEEIYDLLGYGGLSTEIVEYLTGMLYKSENFKPVELFERLEYFFDRWCNGEFIDGKFIGVASLQDDIQAGIVR